MTTLPGRDGRALLVIDVQNDVVGECFERDAVVERIGRLVDAARAADVPVVWVQHQEEGLAPGSDGWQIVSTLAPAEGELRVDKRYRSAFEDTTLDAALESLGAGTLVLCGAESNFCVRHTLHSALERGYDVLLASDAHTAWHGTWGETTVDGGAIIAEQNRNAAGYALPGRGCDVRTTTDLIDAFVGA